MRLKELRKNEGISQEELAKKLGITQATYSRYEQGTTSIPIDFLYKLADYYNVSIDYLIGRKFPNDLGLVSSEQFYLFKKILLLNSTNLVKLTGYVDSLVESQK